MLQACLDASSDLRIHIQMDPRYQAFSDRATRKDVRGSTMLVAKIDDVSQGKVWAAMDHDRRPSKRQKDLADMLRLIEAEPRLRALVPAKLQDQFLKDASPTAARAQVPAPMTGRRATCARRPRRELNC
jgi:hypothetical protein